MTSQFDEKAIFDVARQIDAEAARIDYLKQVCGDDQKLFDRVSALIHIRSQQLGFLETPAASIAPTIESPVSRTPRHPDRPLQAAAGDRRRGHGRRLHGRAEGAGPPQGGAEDHQAGHGHPAKSIARFEAERQALALMDHPNIAKVSRCGHDRRRVGPTS